MEVRRSMKNEVGLTETVTPENVVAVDDSVVQEVEVSNVKREFLNKFNPMKVLWKTVSFCWQTRAS